MRYAPQIELPHDVTVDGRNLASQLRLVGS